MTSYILIMWLMYSGGNSPSVTHMTFTGKQACESALDYAQKHPGNQWIHIYGVCVPAVYSGPTPYP